MGYLDNSTITVDAILTKKGRELLARGRNEFQISQFALADDEVDYDLYNSEHPFEPHCETDRVSSQGCPI